MGIFSGFFRSRDMPQNRTTGSACSFFFGIVFFVSFLPVALEAYIEYRAEGPLFALPSGFCYRIFLIILFILSFILPLS